MKNPENPMPAPTQREATLFIAARQRPPAERAAFLDGACLGDAALRQRLEALLAANDTGNPFPEPAERPPGHEPVPTIKLRPEDAPDEAVGQTIGRYKVLERIGEGGCGVVYVAEQTEPVRRRVALKVIKLGMDTEQVVARFEAERQALAMMDHPNIAKVLDAGSTETGRPYFIMELVRGIRITDYCDQNNLSASGRLELFIKICQAIQHAHQKGIIHRDIKPSNILVTLHDGVPVPKVIDFGIAKATEGRLTDNTVYTQLHQFIGTPAYMSPEQAEMSGLDIDTRSDIYSLGVLLYELLTGKTPFDAQELMSLGIDAMRKTIREQDPVRPSTKLATLEGEELTTTARRRSVETSKLAKLLRGDVDWIVMKCLEKDRTRRYETANGLAVDLKRHLNNETVMARPPSAAYRFQKAFRRNKLAFAAGTAIAAALVLGIIGTSIGLVRAEKQRREAEAARNLAEQRFLGASHFVDDMFQQVLPKFQDLIGATEAQQSLAQISLNFLESLGGTNGGGEAYEGELAKLDRQLAAAFGDPFLPNTIGDYSNALRFASQSLAIRQNLASTHPDDQGSLTNLAKAEEQVGAIMEELDHTNEAQDHFQKSLDLYRQLLAKNPDDKDFKDGVRIENLKIGNVLADEGRTKEALEQYYLPNTKEWRDHLLDLTLDSRSTHIHSLAHELVGWAELRLGQDSDALPQFEVALQWKKILLDREPNNARYLRDWSEIHGDLGRAQIALGRFDEGFTNLDEALRVAESLAERDPANGSSQDLLIGVLQDEAKDCAKVAGSPGISRTRQAELWQRAITALTHRQEILDSPQLKQWTQAELTRAHIKIETALGTARDAYAKLRVDAETNSTGK